VVGVSLKKSTALGVAHMAGMGVGLWQQEDLAARWMTDRVFEPAISHDERERLHRGWLDAVYSVTGSPALRDGHVGLEHQERNVYA